MAAEVHAQPAHEDLHEHPAKKLRTVDGSCRRSNLGVRVTSALQVTNDLVRDAPEPQAPCVSTAFAEASSARATDPDPQPVDMFPAPVIEASAPIPTPAVLRRPQLEQPELSSSLDGWLKHNNSLPALKKLRRDSTCSMQSLDAWMDTGGYTSPAPGSPQWFRLQPSPARQAMRASPSIEIQVLSPVFPEQYPDDIDMMSEGDPDDDFCLCPPSPGSATTSSPLPDRIMASPATTPRRRAPSRLGWRSPRPHSAEPGDPASQPPPHDLGTSTDGAPSAAPAAGAGTSSATDGTPSAAAAAGAATDSAGTQTAAAAQQHHHEGGEEAEGGAGCTGGGAVAAHNAAELRALEFRLLQLLHTGNGMVLVADALRLFRGYMEEAADKDAVRAMLKRWCVLVEHPVGSGCRWLYLRSAAEAAGATIPDA